MNTVGEARARGRDDARRLILDAARDLAVEQGWRAVRMGELATRVGISRQALHQEFGAKPQIAAALVHREITELLDGFATALADHSDDVYTAFVQAATFTLEAIAGNPLLQIVISGQGDETLLALITTRGDWMIRQVADVIQEWGTTEFPDLPADRLREMAVPVARLALSMGVVPMAPIPEAAAELARAACLLIGHPDPAE